MQKSSWWWQCSVRYSRHLHPPPGTSVPASTSSEKTRRWTSLTKRSELDSSPAGICRVELYTCRYSEPDLATHLSQEGDAWYTRELRVVPPHPTLSPTIMFGLQWRPMRFLTCLSESSALFASQLHIFSTAVPARKTEFWCLNWSRTHCQANKSKASQVLISNRTDRGKNKYLTHFKQKAAWWFKLVCWGSGVGWWWEVCWGI